MEQRLRKISEETRRKLSNALKGRKLTEAHKRAIAEGNKGKFVSEHTRNLLSEINIGKKLSEETKEKMCKASKTKRACEINGIIYPSVKRASSDLKIPRTTVAQRLRSMNFSSYKYIEVQDEVDPTEETMA